MTAPAIRPEVGTLDPHLVDLDRVRTAASITGFGRGSYLGARGDRRELREWNPLLGSVDSDTLADLATLRARSRDAIRNDPIAGGAIRTYAAAVVGTGLVPRPQIDREVLGISEAEAKRVSTAMLRFWYAWSETRACDLTRRLSYPALTRVVFRDLLGDGDVIGIRRFRPGPDSPLGLRVQLVDADRLCNPNGRPDSDRLRGGIEYGADGEPVRFWIRNRHPADRGFGAVAETWAAVEAIGAESGEPQVLHLFDAERANQSRGVPLLAPVLLPLKQLSRYTEAELMAAVVSAAFTVFLKSEYSAYDGGPMLTLPTDNDNHFGPPPPQPELKLGNGSVIGLNPGESIESANPTRPNAQFEPFFEAILRQVGANIGMPFEILVKHFTSSYSASRGAVQEFWREVRSKRALLATGWCQPCWEWVLGECVARRLLDLPGWDDPLRRRAWSFTAWSGPPPSQINPGDEVAAAEARVASFFSTRQRETAELTGEDWEAVVEQQVRERQLLEAGGLTHEPAGAVAWTEPPPPPAPDDDTEDETEESDDDTEDEAPMEPRRRVPAGAAP